MAIPSWKTLLSRMNPVNRGTVYHGCLQTKRLVSLCIALAAQEEVLLDVVEHGEPSAAGGIGGGVNAIGTGDSLGDGTWQGVTVNVPLFGRHHRSQSPHTLDSLEVERDRNGGEKLFESHGWSDNREEAMRS